MNAVSLLSGGVPRIINLLCDRALETAYAHRAPTVDASFINAAAGELRLPAAVPPACSEPLEGTNEDVVVATEVFASIAAARPARRSGLILATSLALLVAAAWLGTRALKRVSQRETPAQAATSRAAPTIPPSAPAPLPSAPMSGSVGALAAAAAMPPTAPAAAFLPAPAESTGDSFVIVVASFRTEARSTAVAAEIAALGQPVRQRFAGGWQQVLAGPFASRALAADAQQRLERAGFPGTQIAPSP
jgi:cell division septation protein DedD